MPCDFAVQSAAMEKNILPAGRPPSPADKRLPGLAGSPQQGLVRAGARAGPEKIRSAFSIRIYAKILILSDSFVDQKHPCIDKTLFSFLALDRRQWNPVSP
jgi:hypothetical protein